ncbi:putative UPF0481 protein At3g02645 [Zingiber officinale]|uniref:Uncharacterized protein n=1 Tax=Zingiber officinale TaxID=94328 RepID=A0A8J5KUJ4_ZINOF|nr:putative UPF0481 protein At3g02645 [Zingiber officinale]KAG6499943.1 hypothetical protein ZIOFF_039757 [Zingiber officinale]
MASINGQQQQQQNSSPSPNSHHVNNPVFDELRWVIQIRHSLEDVDDSDDVGIPVSVFNVPKSLQVTKPEAYIPQLIALGPYHHWRPELYEMERYKLAAVRRTKKQFHTIKLHHLVQQFTKLEHKIRAHYHRYLDLSGETLAWMMAVDASFLLEFLQVYAAVEDGGGKALRRLSSRMSHLVDYTGRKSAHNVILRDIMMLENQIPLFLLRNILESQSPSAEASDETLAKMLGGLLKELCPFKLLDIFPCGIDLKQHSHLLELLYYVVVPQSDDQSEENEIDEVNDETPPPSKGQLRKGGSSDGGYMKQLYHAVVGIGSGLTVAPIQFVRGVVTSRPVKLVALVPWKILTSLPGFSILKQPFESFCSSALQGQDRDQIPQALINGSSSSNSYKPPLVEEIMIPSVTDLVSSGVKFSPTTGDLSTIAFDTNTATFYLPAVCLDVNTEVILRNLVAYEASAAMGPLVFTRYTELMNGIIDTEEDVRLLREQRVVANRMKSDGQVASLWNGMSRSVRLTRVPFMDKLIEDVNKYHNSRWRVKTGRFMKKYVFGSWQFLTFVAAILLLLLTALQAFCSVYTCSRWFGVVDVQKH